MDDFTCPSLWYLTLSVFWVPKTLGIWVRGYPKHGDTPPNHCQGPQQTRDPGNEVAARLAWFRLRGGSVLFAFENLR